MTKKQVAVIGAGPAGMTAAYRLSQLGMAPDVYEASDRVGGIARTIALWGQKVDLGPHRFFSSDTRVNSVWLDVVGRDYQMVNRLTRIYYDRRFFHYPLKPIDALANLGIAEAASCVLSYSWSRLTPPSRRNDTFEDWVVGRFGRRLFEIFFKSYSEKLWGIACSELDADFAAQRIKKLSLYEAIKSAVLGGRGNRHRTLVDEFAYPNEGTGIVYERMASRVVDAGGRVEYRCPVAEVVIDRGRVAGLRLGNGEFRPYDAVVSSMPLSVLVAGIAAAPREVAAAAGQLRYRNTLLVYLLVDHPDLFRDNWLYVHSDALQTGRITNFRNWVPQICGARDETILALEYWCNDDDPSWNASESDLVQLGMRELTETGLARDARVLDGTVVRLPRSYPVYSRGYKALLAPIQRYLSTIDGLAVVGRSGAFKYNNQDHSILMGLLAAENVAGAAAHDLWTVNTDYEYQERSTITASGLDRGPGFS